MSTRTDIEMIFSDTIGAVRAREIAKAIIAVYYENGCQYLPYDDMKLENADGWLHYPPRYVNWEMIYTFKILFHEYRMRYNSMRRSRKFDFPNHEEAKKLMGSIKLKGCRLMLCNTDISQSQCIDTQYFEDFFSTLCFLLAVQSRDKSFEGMCRTKEDSYTKRILTHAVYDGKTLSFERMEGMPVYHTLILTWTFDGNKLLKSSRKLVRINVEIITEDHDAIKKDSELAQWIDGVNDVKMEMASASLEFRHASYPCVVLYGASREICVRNRDRVIDILTGKGYRTKLFSIVWENECTGPNVVIPDSATKIGDDAFRRDTSLKSVVIPENITEIGRNAFDSCVSLEEIVVPDSVRKIGDFAFSACRSLKAVTLSENLTELSDGLFSHSDKLENVDIPLHVNSIGRFAFSRCVGLRKVTVPSSVKFINGEAFKDCSPELTIRGAAGSEAERFAKENGFGFEVV